MRVNVTYSVELEEVSGLVENILQEIEKQFESLNTGFPEIMHSVVEDQNEKKAVELIKEFRLKLGEIDFRLGDCADILMGYQQTLLQLAAVESMSRAPESEGNDDSSSG
tara:strand:- start:30 stop:356 length:327 start_codon:yes stop_codon:yes gene_type:complete